MASSNNDKTMEHDKEIHKKPKLPIYIPEFTHKLQEKANRVYIPPPPLTNSVHR
jgi:hypothetical protein